MRKHLRLIGVGIAATAIGVLASFALAQPGPGGQYGMGPGMMGGYGPGYGMGPGMMGGYGPGPGMGPGMMGGYGPGPGMGPGMMGGYDPGYGMGPGMMGLGDYRGLDLKADQKAKLSQIAQDLRTKHWALMGRMMEARYKLRELYDADKLDAAAIDQQYKEIDDVRRQMLDSSIEARNQINGILTKEQQEKLRESTRWRGPMMWGY